MNNQQHSITFVHNHLYLDNKLIQHFTYKEAKQFCDEYLNKNYSAIVSITNKKKKYYLLLLAEFHYRDKDSSIYTFSKIHF